MFEILIIAALVVMALACRTSSRWILAKLGLLEFNFISQLAAPLLQLKKQSER
jgi:hypothetical protein